MTVGLDSVSAHDQISNKSCDDAQVCEMRIQRALASCGYRDLSAIGCKVADATVTLYGAVSSFHLKQLAQEIALRACPGNAACNRIHVVGECRKPR